MILVPPGDLRAIATQASPLHKAGGRPRVSHLSLLVPGRVEVRRGALPKDLVALTESQKRDGQDLSASFIVDAGTCCCVDEAAYGEGGDVDFPEFLSGTGVSAGIAAAFNAPAAPAAVFCESGLGDGMYSVVGGFDCDGVLAALHIDFEILDDYDPNEVRTTIAAVRSKERRANVGCVVAAIALFVLIVGVIGAIDRIFPESGESGYTPVYLDPGDPRNLKHQRPR